MCQTSRNEMKIGVAPTFRHPSAPVSRNPVEITLDHREPCLRRQATCFARPGFGLLVLFPLGQLVACRSVGSSEDLVCKVIELVAAQRSVDRSDFMPGFEVDGAGHTENPCGIAAGAIRTHVPE